MKKILICLIGIITLIVITGCTVSENTRGEILNSLKKNKIISDSMELIDTESYSHWFLEWCETDNHYIYKDKDSKLIAIEYKDNRYSKDSKFDYLVTIYYNVTINNDVNAINSEDAICDSDHSYYKYQNGEYTSNGKYEFDIKKEYYATEKSSLFKGKYFSIESAN